MGYWGLNKSINVESLDPVNRADSIIAVVTVSGLTDLACMPHGSLDHQEQFASDHGPMTISTLVYTHSSVAGECKGPEGRDTYRGPRLPLRTGPQPCPYFPPHTLTQANMVSAIQGLLVKTQIPKQVS